MASSPIPTLLSLLFLLPFLLLHQHLAPRNEYMDEPFHASAAQHLFTRPYPSELTTPPFLYLYSRLLLLPTASRPITTLLLPKAKGHIYTFITYIPTLQNLRRSLIPIHLIVWYLLARKLQPIHALTLALHPPLLHTSTLYYTDTLALALCLIAYHLASRKHHFAAALIGVCAVLTRQNTIVWVGYSAASAILAHPAFQFAHHTIYTQRKPTQAAYGVTIRRILTTFNIYKYELIRIALPYILLAAAFVSAVIYNGGIVIGHQENHTAVLHIPQLYYFAVYACAFFAPSIAYGELIPRWFQHVRR